MADDLHAQELTTLKTIAETLNQSNDLTYMLDAVLDRLLELTLHTAKAVGFLASWFVRSPFPVWTTAKFRAVPSARPKTVHIAS